jgi:archaellum component FlaG (FlaF/FlaG flagellin family)
MKYMKKLVVFIAAVIFLAIVASSCSSSVDCPAYGEVQRYQIEQRY